MFAIGEIRSRPVHAAVFGGDCGGLGRRQAIRMEALRRIGEAGRAPPGGPGPGRRLALRARTSTDLVDWILRILISYAAVPGDGGRGRRTRSGASWPPGSSPPSSGRLAGGDRPRRSVRH